MTTPEQEARARIDALLQSAGWLAQDASAASPGIEPYDSDSGAGLTSRALALSMALARQGNLNEPLLHCS